MSPELQWLLSIVWTLDEHYDCIPCLSPIDWEKVLCLAEAHGLAPAVGYALKSRHSETIPASVRGRFARHLTNNLARQILLERELVLLLKRFETERVPVLLLKGPVLAEMVYSHPALRPFFDLDLLIKPDDLVQADQLLLKLGYSRRADAHSWSFNVAYDWETLYEGSFGVQVDLHWGLVTDPRYSWNHLEALGVWERAVQIRVAGEKTLGLSPDDLLLYLALHLAIHHGLVGLLWYWDLALLLKRHEKSLDWQAVVDRASGWKVESALFFALHGVETFMGASLPKWVMDRLKPTNYRAALLGWLLKRVTSKRLARLGHWVPILLIDRNADLSGLLRQILWPPVDWVRARYGGSAPSLPGQYLAHYRRIAQALRS